MTQGKAWEKGSDVNSAFLHFYTPSNKTEVLTKSMNMYIWAIGTLNQLFIRSS